ncbi:hypothetical protein J5N97_025970 [Dioscorea zingiberensis]|uniref:MFT-like protein n=1 Tax=Dioscorea zingiberensis TaxID=325984 RepID=A0A9D5H6F1_9LILI|nr:hypothetical protein J5N97_025970 [Dioscorea zingiberensis]
MTNQVDSLILGRVIGDVLDLFVPSVRMSVHYGGKYVCNGCNIKPSLAIHPPTVQITGRSSDLFTLVMVDADAPNPSEPVLREWIHWIVVDIPGATSPLCGREVAPYMAPRPPLGIHRYVFSLFQQKQQFPIVDAPTSRSNFNTRDFADTFDLGLPVAAVYFNSQKEPLRCRRS